MRYGLASNSYVLDQRLKRHLAAGQLPQDLIQQIREQDIRVPSIVVNRISQHIRHLRGREAIRVDRKLIEARIRKYSKKKSVISKSIARTLMGTQSHIQIDETGDWYRPYVSPFHTKTGRDCMLGASLGQVPKEYWPRLLSPPQGSVYVLLDYRQEEPMIAAMLAGCKPLTEWYEQGDIYQQVGEVITQGALSREQAKKVVNGWLNGMSEKTIADELSQSIQTVRLWMSKLKSITHPVEQYLVTTAKKIKQKGEVRLLDWRCSVSDSDGMTALRNWQVQGTGADIMRRACLALDDAQIPLLLTEHDSFLVRLEEDKYTDQLERAIKALTDASATVLGGFQLRVKVDMSLPSSS